MITLTAEQARKLDHAANGRDTPIDFLRCWNIGYALFDEFSGDRFTSTTSLDSLQVYDPEETYENRYHPMSRADMASAVRATHREQPFLRGHTYRIYARYQVQNPGGFRRFIGLQVLDKLALVGPRGTAVKVGEVEL